MSGAQASAVPGIDFGQLLAETDVKEEEVLQAVEEAQPQKTAIEDMLEKSAAEEAMTSKPTGKSMQFRALLSDEQRAALEAATPGVAERMIKDYSQIINFGAPVMEKMNQSASALLKEQKNIKIPEADEIVNNLMREMDGYNARYRNEKIQNFGAKIKKFFGGAKYNLETMIRDAKPISDRLDMAELSIRKMELDLEKNGARATQLHKDTLATMNDVVAVLASLESISDYLHEKFERIDAALVAAGSDERIVEFEGKKYSYAEFKEVHADYANGISEIEKSWFDWRQQFFIGYATAPTLRNLIAISASMQRRLLVFRTQGIPAARRGLAMWQQAALAKGTAEVGDALQAGTNKMLQNSFDAASDAVEYVANAAQAPIVTEETVFKVIESVQKQASALVEADRAGREARLRNLDALEKGELAIKTADEEGRRKLVEQVVRAARETDITKSGDVSGALSGDILSSIGVKS